MAGYIMPTPSQKISFSETQIDKLVEIFNNSIYGIYEEQDNKYFKKGLAVEEDSRTLYSRVTKRLFIKNNQRITNDYITGEWDMHIERLGVIDEIVDLKSSYSKNTFDKSRVKKMNMIYYWQLQCYMWLTGAKSSTLAYCLVNNTGKAIRDEKYRLSFKQGMQDENEVFTDLYYKKCQQIERNNIFDLDLFIKHNQGFEFDTPENKRDFNIPMKERVYAITIERNEDEIEALKNRIIDCRQWITENLLTNNN